MNVILVPEPLQTAVEPAIDAVGLDTTVIVCVAEQPPLLVYVITTEPCPTAETTPEVETVATAVLELLQGVVASGVPDPVSVTVPPTHKPVEGALIVGIGLTTKVVVDVHGTPATVAVTVYV